MAYLKLIHLLSIVIWVGGMFFAYIVLRPVAAEILQPPERLQLWKQVFSRFFKWVWPASVLILLSGLYMIHLYGGMKFVPHSVHLMLLLGLVMLLIFAYVFFAQYLRFSKLVANQDWPQAGTILLKIRKLIAFNLSLGLLTIVVAILGRSL
ncbi:MAG: CopD family protein [Gallionellaceae bacterium]